MKAGPVLLDTGVFVAYIDRSDAHHAYTVRLFHDPPRRWCTSLLVVAEAYGWFLHRLGEDIARAFRQALSEFPRLELLAIDADHHQAVVAKLERFRGHKLTYVDASNLVFLEKRRIAEVWGTDTDLGLEGAHVEPGPR